MKASQGFTLLEVALAGAVLMIGIVTAFNLTTTVLDATRPGEVQSVQDGRVVDQYLHAVVARIKASPSNPGIGAITLPTMRLGNATLYVEATVYAGAGTRGVRLLPGGVNNGTFFLDQYDVYVQMALPSAGQAPATDPILAHTSFVKLGRNDGQKAGI